MEEGEEEPRLLWLLLSCLLQQQLDLIILGASLLHTIVMDSSSCLTVPFAPHTIPDSNPFLPVKQALEALEERKPRS